MPATPYRVPPPGPPPACDRCGAVILAKIAPHRSSGGALLCKPCFLSRNDVLGLLGVAALFAGAFRGSGPLLVWGIVILGLGALAVHARED